MARGPSTDRRSGPAGSLVLAAVAVLVVGLVVGFVLVARNDEPEVVGPRSTEATEKTCRDALDANPRASGGSLTFSSEEPDGRTSCVVDFTLDQAADLAGLGFSTEGCAPSDRLVLQLYVDDDGLTVDREQTLSGDTCLTTL